MMSIRKHISNWKDQFRQMDTYEITLFNDEITPLNRCRMSIESRI